MNIPAAAISRRATECFGRCAPRGRSSPPSSCATSGMRMDFDLPKERGNKIHRLTAVLCLTCPSLAGVLERKLVGSGTCSMQCRTFDVRAPFLCTAVGHWIPGLLRHSATLFWSSGSAMFSKGVFLRSSKQKNLGSWNMFCN